MAQFSFKKVLGSVPQFLELSNEIIRSVNQLLDGNIANGVLITDVALTSGQANIINHKLSRLPIGYVITYINTNVSAPIWQNDKNNLTIDLRTSTNCVVNVWVF
jgi:hypothetical protein